MEHSNKDVLGRLQLGDEQAALVVVGRYEDRLQRLAQSLLSRRLQQRVDAADVTNSAWRSFFLAARAGKVNVPEHDELWPLLATILARKVARHADWHRALKRDVGRELVVDPVAFGNAIHPPEAGANDLQELLLRGLPLAEQNILQLLLQGYDQREVAVQSGCSERTVRRLLHRLKRETVTSLSSQRFGYGELHLLEYVGQGAIAKVYRSLLDSIGDVVAVKFLKRAYWAEPRAVKSILDEAELASRVRSPHIVQHYGWGTTRAGGIFLVMEWIDGLTLDQWSAVSHSHDELTACATQIGTGIAALHAAGIVHGDLSLRNIMRRQNGSIVIIDLGQARHLTQGHLPHGGTPAFLAPEVESGGLADERADLYSWAAVMAELFRRSEQAALPEVIVRCLAKMPEQRPGSMDEVFKLMKSS
ncbi:MAG: protein kinase [Gemmatales bacterium]